MTARNRVKSQILQFGLLLGIGGILQPITNISVDAAGVGVGVGVGRTGVSAGVSAGAVSVGTSVGRSVTSASVGVGSSGLAGNSVGVGASASVGASAGVSASAGANAGGPSTGISASASPASGLAAGTSVGGTNASVGISSVSPGGLSAVGGPASGVGISVGNTASQPNLNGGSTASQQSQTASTTTPTADMYAVQSAAPTFDSPYLERGVGSLDSNYRVRCSSWFCQSHLLGRAPSRRVENAAVNPGYHYRTFDDVIRAAERGDSTAEFTVAEVLAGGHGVAANPRRSALWYARAAAHGNTLAISRLNRLRAAVADVE